MQIISEVVARLLQISITNQFPLDQVQKVVQEKCLKQNFK